ncbi:NAD(+) kinase [Dongshaea marina]|uniref:NAD(+) kinase n=1 Tax=Dongshaea marina TaxID=2047966 RepID=UPI000D3E83E0|nr:NAD(+) kinase [Dongshaea marina]
MSQHFKKIALIGKLNHPETKQTLHKVMHYLEQHKLSVLVEERIADELGVSPDSTRDLVTLGQKCDLAIMVGGDGNMLGVARVLSRFDISVVGINRGNLGFLTDLSPCDFETQLTEILRGEYQTEHRFLLEAQVYRHDELKASNSAMNEAALHLGKIGPMIEFEVYIDGAFMYSQRADGIIVTTPTGSTAYAMSAGGPILTPSLNAIALVPMHPHTLSCRPIAVDSDSEIKLVVSPNSRADEMQISCDGQVALTVLPGDEILIRKTQHQLRLLHPHGYSYFHILRKKLGWGSKLF